MRKKILSIILTTTMVLGLTPCIPCVKQVKAESSWKFPPQFLSAGFSPDTVLPLRSLIRTR